MYIHLKRGSPRRVMVNKLDYNIVVSEFELQSYYYVHFRTFTIGKRTNSFITTGIS